MDQSSQHNRLITRCVGCSVGQSVRAHRIGLDGSTHRSDECCVHVVADKRTRIYENATLSEIDDLFAHQDNGRRLVVDRRLNDFREIC